MNKMIGLIIGVFVVFCAMFLASAAVERTVVNYFDTVSFLFVIGVAYGGMVAAYGTFSPNLKGLQLMNKLFLPVGWLGFLIGMVMMLFGLDNCGDDCIYKFGLSLAVALITVLYAILFRIVFTIIIASKE